MEASDIKYSGARDKVYQFKIRQLYHYNYQLMPKDFIEKLGVRFDDPNAKYSLSYYGYLNNISTLKLYELTGRQNVSPNDMYKYIKENIGFAKMNLHSDLKELYITQRICALLSNRVIKDALTNNDRLYFQRVDSLLEDARDTYKHTVLADILSDFLKKEFNIASKKI